MTGSPRQRTLDPLSGVEPDEHPLSIRSLYVLLVVLLSGWVLGAALRLSSELAGWWVRWATAALSLGVLGSTCILGGAEAKDLPAAWFINTGMTGESDGLISDTGALLDRVRTTLVQLNRDQEPDPSEGLEGHHVAVAASAGDQRSLWNVVGGRQDLPSGACLWHVSAGSTSCRVASSNNGDRLSSQPHNNAGPKA